MDSKRNSKDRNAQQPQNGQMMTELKYLKAQLAVKDKRIKELETQYTSAVLKIKDLEDEIKTVKSNAEEDLTEAAEEVKALQGDRVIDVV